MLSVSAVRSRKRMRQSTHAGGRCLEEAKRRAHEGVEHAIVHDARRSDDAKRVEKDAVDQYNERGKRACAVIREDLQNPRLIEHTQSGVDA